MFNSKLWALLFCLLCSPALAAGWLALAQAPVAAPSAPTLVYDGLGSGTTGSNSVAYGSTTASIPTGALALIFIRGVTSPSNSPATGITDSAGNTYTQAIATSSASTQYRQVALWYKANATTLPTSGTITVTGSGAGFVASIAYITNATAPDSGATLDLASGTTFSLATTPIATNDVAIGFFATNNASSLSSNPGFTSLSPGTFGTSLADYSYQTLSSAAKVTYHPTVNISGAFDALIVTFASSVAAYTGPGDIVSGATAWYGLRGYSSATATKLTQKSVNVTNSNTSETCDILVAPTGALGNVTGCSGSSNGTTAATFCSTFCGVNSWYDQSGAFACAGSVSCSSTTTSPQVVALTFNCFGSLPCATISTQAIPGGTQTLTSAIASPWTIEAVAERSVLNGGQQFLGDDNGNAFQGSSTANLWKLFSLGETDATATDGVVHVAQGLSAPTPSINIDNTITNGTAATQSSFGVNFVVANSFQGEWFEAGIWPQTFNTTQQTNICHNAHAYWGTATSC